MALNAVIMAFVQSFSSRIGLPTTCPLKPLLWNSATIQTELAGCNRTIEGIMD